MRMATNEMARLSLSTLGKPKATRKISTSRLVPKREANTTSRVNPATSPAATRPGMRSLGFIEPPQTCDCIHAVSEG